MVSINIPSWIYEAGIYGVAALIFCIVMLPIMYLIGFRDGKKMNREAWVLVGYKNCLMELTGGLHRVDLLNWMRHRSDPNIRDGLVRNES